MLTVQRPNVTNLFAAMLAPEPAPSIYLDTDFCQYGDLIGAMVNGDVVAARVIYVSESRGCATVQWRRGNLTIQTEVCGDDILGVIMREEIRRGDRVEVFRYGQCFEAIVVSMMGSVIELSSGIVIDYCQITRRVAAAAAETVTA